MQQQTSSLIFFVFDSFYLGKKKLKLSFRRKIVNLELRNKLQ